VSQRCAAIVSIPCVGVKNSLNVGVAFGICLYEISRQWHLELQVQPHPATTDVPTTGDPGRGDRGEGDS
jgi:tRNA C32,U32 (ribose-2'-O)-methylase TrmJ